MKNFLASIFRVVIGIVVFLILAGLLSGLVRYFEFAWELSALQAFAGVIGATVVFCVFWMTSVAMKLVNAVSLHSTLSFVKTARREGPHVPGIEDYFQDSPWRK